MILAASILPGVPPAPIIVCISSINTIISGCSFNSLSKAFIRSSNCPRYLVPATIDAISSATIFLLNSTGDVFRCTISCARFSTMALLPTPGSPISIGLFFFLRQRISARRRISRSLPTTGSSNPSLAALVKSVEKLSSIGVLLFVCSVFVVVLPALSR